MRDQLGVVENLLAQVDRSRAVVERAADVVGVGDGGFRGVVRNAFAADIGQKRIVRRPECTSGASGGNGSQSESTRNERGACELGEAGRSEHWTPRDVGLFRLVFRADIRVR